MSQLSDNIYDALDGYFTPKIPVGTPAGVVAEIQDNWRSLAEAFAMAPSLPGGLETAIGNANTQVAYYVTSTKIDADSTFTFDVGTGTLGLDGKLRLDERATPATPPSGYGYLYAKTDGIYYIGDDGVEHALIEATDLSTLTARVSANEDEIQDIGDACDGYQASITAHTSNTSNPHSVTAAQVGNTVAQWNAQKLQGRIVDFQLPNDGDYLMWNESRGLWEPEPNNFDGYVTQDDVADWEPRIAANENEIQVIGDACDGYQNQLDQHWGSIQDLDARHSNAIEDVTNTLDGYQDQLDTLEVDLDNLEAQTAGALETLRYDHSMAIEDITNELDGYQDQLDQHAGSIDTLRTDHSNWVEVASNEMDGYQNQLNQHAGSISTLRSDFSSAVEDITNELDGYQDQIDQHSGSIDTLRSDFSSAVEDITNDLDGYQDSIDVLEGGLQTLREDHSNWVEVASNEMDGYQDQLDQHWGSIQDLDARHSEAINDITQACDGYTAQVFGEDAYGDGYIGLVPESDFTGRKYLRDDATWQRVIPQTYSFTDVESVQIEHNLDYYPIVQLIDSLGRYFIPVNVIHYSTSLFKVTFIESFTGTIVYF
jgi:t-SNARE complex subunit (syntaxin)